MGSQRSALAREKVVVARVEERAQNQVESGGWKVSIDLLRGAHHRQRVFTHEATFARGGSPRPLSTSLTPRTSGSVTGNWSSGTGIPLPRDRP